MKNNIKLKKKINRKIQLTEYLIEQNRIKNAFNLIKRLGNIFTELSRTTITIYFQDEHIKYQELIYSINKKMLHIIKQKSTNSN